MYGGYNNSSYNMDGVYGEAIKELTKYVPRVYLTKNSAGYSDLVNYGSNVEGEVIVQKPSVYFTGQYYDAGTVTSDGDLSVNLVNPLEVTYEGIRKNGGFEKKEEAKAPERVEIKSNIEWEKLQEMLDVQGLKKFSRIMSNFKKKVAEQGAFAVDNDYYDWVANDIRSWHRGDVSDAQIEEIADILVDFLESQQWPVEVLTGPDRTGILQVGGLGVVIGMALASWGLPVLGGVVLTLGVASLFVGPDAGKFKNFGGYFWQYISSFIPRLGKELSSALRHESSKQVAVSIARTTANNSGRTKKIVTESSADSSQSSIPNRTDAISPIILTENVVDFKFANTEEILRGLFVKWKNRVNTQTLSNENLRLIEEFLRAYGKPMDRDRLVNYDIVSTALRELLKNAFDAYISAAAEGKIRFRMMVEGNFLVFEVSDNGIGIEEQYYDNTGRLHVVPNDVLPYAYISTRYGGAGLGMLHTQILAQVHGGSLKYLTGQNDGYKTTARLTIPMTTVSIKFRNKDGRVMSAKTYLRIINKDKIEAQNKAEEDLIIQQYGIDRTTAEQAVRNGWTVERMKDIENINDNFCNIFEKRFGFTVRPKIIFKPSPNLPYNIATISRYNDPQINSWVFIAVTRFNYKTAVNTINNWYLEEFAHALQNNLFGERFASFPEMKPTDYAAFCAELKKGFTAKDSRLSVPPFNITSVTGRGSQYGSFYMLDEEILRQLFEVHAAALAWILSLTWLPQESLDSDRRFAYWDAAARIEEAEFPSHLFSGILPYLIGVRTPPNSSIRIPSLASHAAMWEAVLELNGKYGFIPAEKLKKIEEFVKIRQKAMQVTDLEGKNIYLALKESYKAYFLSVTQSFINSDKSIQELVQNNRINIKSNFFVQISLAITSYLSNLKYSSNIVAEWADKFMRERTNGLYGTELPMGVFIAENIGQLSGVQFEVKKYLPVVITSTKGNEKEIENTTTKNLGVTAGHSPVFFSQENSVVYLYIDAEGADFAVGASQIMATLRGYGNLEADPRALKMLGIRETAKDNAVVFDYTGGALDRNMLSDTPVVPGENVNIGFGAIRELDRAHKNARAPAEVGIERGWSDELLDRSNIESFNNSIIIPSGDIFKLTLEKVRQLQSEGARVHAIYEGSDIEQARAFERTAIGLGLNGIFCPALSPEAMVSLTKLDNSEPAGFIVSGQLVGGSAEKRKFYSLELSAADYAARIAAIRDTEFPVVSIKLGQLSTADAAKRVEALKDLPSSAIIIFTADDIKNNGMFRDISEINIFGANLLKFLRLTPRTISEKEAFQRRVAFELDFGTFEVPQDAAAYMENIRSERFDLTSFPENTEVLAAAKLHLSEESERSAQRRFQTITCQPHKGPYRACREKKNAGVRK